MTYTKRFARIKSRHPSHSCFRKHNGGILANRLAVVRFGSVSESSAPIEINSIKAIKTSSSKILMKTAFDTKGVNSPKWYKNIAALRADRSELSYPIIAKKVFGSRGQGMKKFDDEATLFTFVDSNPSGYYFEEYKNYAREYRLHVTEEGCFYTCRKMIKSDTPEENRWFKNDSNCVWILEENPSFAKPANWNEIEADCVKALKAVGLDFGACDVRVRSEANDNGKHKFTIIEINSAPSMGAITEEKYKVMLPKLINRKANGL